MSGNSHQRKIDRHHRELLELGRHAKAEIDTRAAEIAALRAGHESQLAAMRTEHVAEIESWARSSRSDADTIASLRSELRSTRELAVGLQLRLDAIEEMGLVTRREHEVAVEQETARLRERLRRATEERLAPKKLLIDHTQEERRLRDALVRQRENIRAIAASGDTVTPKALRDAADLCIAEIGGALGDRE